MLTCIQETGVTEFDCAACNARVWEWVYYADPAAGRFGAARQCKLPPQHKITIGGNQRFLCTVHRDQHRRDEQMRSRTRWAFGR